MISRKFTSWVFGLMIILGVVLLSALAIASRTNNSEISIDPFFLTATQLIGEVTGTALSLTEMGTALARDPDLATARAVISNATLDTWKITTYDLEPFFLTTTQLIAEANGTLIPETRIPANLARATQTPYIATLNYAITVVYERTLTATMLESTP